MAVTHSRDGRTTISAQFGVEPMLLQSSNLATFEQYFHLTFSNGILHFDFKYFIYFSNDIFGVFLDGLIICGFDKVLDIL